jgi:FKBP-type peptidyl-prolyl cis-trans isomerase
MKRFSSLAVSCVLFGISLVLLVLLMREMSVKKPASYAGDKEPAKAPEIKKPETVDERMSYAYAMMVHRQLTEKGYPLDIEQFIAAVRTASSGGELLLNDEDIKTAFAEADSKLAANQEANIDKSALEKGQDFLAENGKKEGIITTASRLQYQVIHPGDGPKPHATDIVSVHYHGTLIDGTVFDSSVERGEPATFPLYQVIPGWTEGLALMSTGAKYKFFIPNELAYGPSSAGPIIRPYSALIFEIELLSFK